ncbi:MAG: hypothetical protein ACYTAS_02435 [Planctomycetota bacterium]
MKKFQFLLLDAGPIIKLFELGIWDKFISRCDVTICRTVAEEAKWATRDMEDICIDLERDEEEGRIRVVDVQLSLAKAFYDKFDTSYQAMLHDGEKETLAFLFNSSEDWRVCAADKAIFKVLGVMGRSKQGASLEKILTQIGLGRQLNWPYTEKFRQQYTRLGQTDSIQDQGFR